MRSSQLSPGGHLSPWRSAAVPHAALPLFGLPILVAAFEAPPLKAQRVGDTPCRCAIETTELVRLGADTDPAGFAPLVQVAGRPGSGYWVSSATFVGEVFHYDAAGRLAASFGRRGNGPGEFAAPLLLAVGPSDEVFAVEMGSNRFHVRRRDGSHVRTTHLTQGATAIGVTPSGGLVVTSPASTVPMWLDSEGRRLAEAAGVAHPEDEARPGIRPSFLAVDSAGHVWTMGRSEIALLHWTPDRTLAGTLLLEREWLPRSETPIRFDPRRERPQGQLAGLMLDDNGLVWVFGIVADKDWRRLATDAQPEPRRLFDTVVEVIDPGRASVVHTARFDEVLIPFGPNLLYEMVTTSSGDRRIRVLRAELAEP